MPPTILKQRSAFDKPSSTPPIFLVQHPELGRRIRHAAARHSQIRWFIVPKFRNYLIFYQPFQETVMVVRVLHAAQDWMRYFPTSQNPQA